MICDPLQPHMTGNKPKARMKPSSRIADTMDTAATLPEIETTGIGIRTAPHATLAIDPAIGAIGIGSKQARNVVLSVVSKGVGPQNTPKKNVKRDTTNTS
jgi:hypothetical protein